MDGRAPSIEDVVPSSWGDGRRKGPDPRRHTSNSDQNRRIGASTVAHFRGSSDGVARSNGGKGRVHTCRRWRRKRPGGSTGASIDGLGHVPPAWPWKGAAGNPREKRELCAMSEERKQQKRAMEGHRKRERSHHRTRIRAHRRKRRRIGLRRRPLRRTEKLLHHRMNGTLLARTPNLETWQGGRCSLPVDGASGMDGNRWKNQRWDALRLFQLLMLLRVVMQPQSKRTSPSPPGMDRCGATRTNTSKEMNTQARPSMREARRTCRCCERGKRHHVDPTKVQGRTGNARSGMDARKHASKSGAEPAVTKHGKGQHPCTRWEREGWLWRRFKTGTGCQRTGFSRASEGQMAADRS